jgi:GxxExxY protein
MDENRISNVVIGAAIEVHRLLGPGLLESVYQQSLSRELTLRGIDHVLELPLSASYKGVEFETAYRLDMLVLNKVIIELKVVENIKTVHEAQLLSYLKLSGRRLGIILNFNVPVMRNGIRRVVNQL